MAEAAKVKSLDALRDFKAALLEFIDEGKGALSGASSDIQRTVWWLQQDRRAHWEREIRQRTEKVAQAKSELYRKQLQATADGGRPSDVDERKALQKAQMALEEAQRKLEATKKWAAALDREFLLYRGQVQPLGRVLDADLPKAVIKLDRMVTALEKYLLERAPDTDRLLGGAPASASSEVASVATSQPGKIASADAADSEGGEAP